MREKKTKIICTISDRRCNREFLQELYDNGMNVVRINTAHLTPETAINIVENTRAVSEKIAILIDTKGPEVRLTKMENDNGIAVKAGETVTIKGGTADCISSRETIYTNYPDFVKDVPSGAEILVDDGDISMTVIEKNEEALICRINNDSVIKSRKSVNVPNVSIKLPAVTEKDRQFIEWAIEKDLDFIAHSFVRSEEDLKEIQQIIDSKKGHIKIISKIENQEGVDNIDGILEHCYGIMVARGDLGVEIAAEKIPIVQRMLIDKCRARKRPVIIATQMLHTMIENPRPTRAEISDIANAIFEYTDAIMLSGETANGKYPVEAVQTMTKVALEVENQHSPETDIAFKGVTEQVAVVLAKSIVEASTKLPMKALLIDTMSGRTGRYLSAFRPNIPIYATCYSPHVSRELALSYGIYTNYVGDKTNRESFVQRSAKYLCETQKMDPKDLIGVLAGSYGYKTGASFIEISTIENMMK